MARSSRRAWALAYDRNALLPLEPGRHAAADVPGFATPGRRRRSDRLGDPLCRQHRRSSPPACSWWEKGALRALGRSRGGFGTKTHLRTDRKGNPLVFTLTGGEKHDAPQLLKIVDSGSVRRAGRGRPRLRPAWLAGDKAYDSSALRTALRRRGIKPLIPTRSNRKRALPFDKERYRIVSRGVVYELESRAERPSA